MTAEQTTRIATRAGLTVAMVGILMRNSKISVVPTDHQTAGHPPLPITSAQPCTTTTTGVAGCAARPGSTGRPVTLLLEGIAGAGAHLMEMSGGNEAEDDTYIEEDFEAYQNKRVLDLDYISPPQRCVAAGPNQIEPKHPRVVPPARPASQATVAPSPFPAPPTRGPRRPLRRRQRHWSCRVSATPSAR
mgnify:CR=1 FL=1